MRYVSLLVASLLLFAVSGCATQTIQKGKDLSTSGIAYAEAVDKLLDVTVDRVIDFDSEELLLSRYGERADLEKMLQEKNQALDSLITEIDAFRSHTKFLKLYFESLQALADSPVKNDAGAAVKKLSDSISNFDILINKESGKAKLTEDQKSQIGALAGMAANAIHAAVIKSALKRDATIIGEYLVLQEMQLKNLAGMLDDRFQVENDVFYRKYVLNPYVNVDTPIDAGWSTNRKKWFKSKFIIPQLETAHEAAKQLQAVWKEIVEGKSDIGSVRVLISEVNEFVQVVTALRTSTNAAAK